MPDIPHAVLTEALEQRLQGRRVVSAVFLTYKFDPAFFEQQVLPSLFDLPWHRNAMVRQVQLADALRTMAGEVAVYYDGNGLIAGDQQSAKLDVRRIPVFRPAIFHPKNIFLLVEGVGETTTERALLTACLSANLTQAGWWENVEVCHFEEVRQGEGSLLRDHLRAFLRALKQQAMAGQEQSRALDDVANFLRDEVESRSNRSAGNGLLTHFYTGSGSLLEFLDKALGSSFRGANLEILSPYFDDADTSRPLLDLIEAFSPQEVRVMVPRDVKGCVACRKSLYDEVEAMDGVTWGHLPSDCTKVANGEDVLPRFVHAKVYRFFSRNPRREVLLVGSPNLTVPAHSDGGNLETAFLVEVPGHGRLDFWLEPETSAPTEFAFCSERDEDGDKTQATLPLVLRFDWGTHEARALWQGKDAAGAIHLAARGVALGTIPNLAPRVWTVLTSDLAAALEEHLKETSFIVATTATVPEATILVQEEGMALKPVGLSNWTVADILNYWATLTPAQRVTFIETHWPGPMPPGDDAEFLAGSRIRYHKDTLFDRCAGFFQGFNGLEKAVRRAVAEGRDKDAVYRLFGHGYDSLDSLLNRLAQGTDLDAVDQYLIVKCVQQLLKEVSRSLPDFWASYAKEGAALTRVVRELGERLRATLCAGGDPSMADFLQWFDDLFMKRAKGLEMADGALQ